MPFLGVQPSRGLVGTAGIDADAITSAKIADDQIDSEHYAAGSIDTAHIAANQIDGTLTKDALIADYSDVTITAADLIMYGDATDSNNTKRDTVQGILDLASGGSWVHLSTLTASSSSSLDFESVISGTYDTYVFIFSGIDNSSNTSILAKTSTDNGSSYDGSSGNYHDNVFTGDSATSSTVMNNSESRAYIGIADSGVWRGLGNATTDCMDGYFWIHDVNSAAHHTNYQFSVTFSDNEADNAFAIGWGKVNLITNVDAIQFYPNSGTITSGTISCFGIVKS
jgi:hypothetical protein